MKSYTDIEQSKKLAELLPLESVDMYYGESGDINMLTKPSYWYISCPCWSLAALLEMLPTIDDGNRNPIFCKDIRFNKWHVVYHGTAVEPTIDSGLFDNLIDACVEMIFILKQRNLL